LVDKWALLAVEAMRDLKRLLRMVLLPGEYKELDAADIC